MQRSQSLSLLLSSSGSCPLFSPQAPPSLPPSLAAIGSVVTPFATNLGANNECERPASCELSPHITHMPPESPTGVSLVQSASISWPLHCPIKMQLHATHCRAHARCSPLLSNRALWLQDLEGQTLTRRVPVPIGKRMSCAEKNKIK